MSNKQCDIVRDLMPLVIDFAASEESSRLVEAHVSECVECNQLMNDMRAEIKPRETDEKDEDFVRFCLKMRRMLSWRKLLRMVLACVLVVTLIVGGVAYTRYKMYVDWIVAKPAEYNVFVDQDGLLVFEYISPERQHGSRGYGTSYDNGICYFTPHISAWPQYFERLDERITYDFINSIRIKGGALVFGLLDDEEHLVFDEFTGQYLPEWKMSYAVIRELRIGTEADYEIAYRAGDELPVVYIEKGIN